MKQTDLLIQVQDKEKCQSNQTKTKKTNKVMSFPQYCFTEILPPGKGRRWGCRKDPVAGRRLIAVVMLLVWILIQIIVLFGNSCLLVSKTQTGTSHIPLDLRNPVQTAGHLLKKTNEKRTQTRSEIHLKNRKVHISFSPTQSNS